MGSTPSSRIRRSVLSALVFVAMVAGITVTSLVATSTNPAGASGLERFSSCADLRQWTATPPIDSGVVGGEDEQPARRQSAPAATATASAGVADTDTTATAGADEGGTNTVVAGVDEIDITDRISQDRLVVARNGALSLVDLRSRRVISEVPGIPSDARVSATDDLVWVVGTNAEGTGTSVRRVHIEGDDLIDGDEWSTPGSVLDARRTGESLHLVAVDYPRPGVVPFDGGPVPCEEVWRPVDPVTDQSATLVVTLPVVGPLVPSAAAEVVGAGSNLLVTADAVFVATTTWSPDQVATGLHRFDLDTLAPSGSGSVPGTLAGSFALDEHDGFLRVATNLAAFGGPVPLAMEDLEETEDRAVASGMAVARPGPMGPDELAEVFVLDTDGDLDIVGRSGGFGHEGETIHGVRFVGAVAYVVTFLTTDPFWVIDLADPRAPAVVGELEIPGFSAYLHPVDDDRVVGFGPDGNGHVAARLFDVSDPAAPAVLAEVELGDESPVVWDYHAYVGLDDGRFAVPVNDWPTVFEERCDTDLPLVPERSAGNGVEAPGSPGVEPSPPCQLITRGGGAGVAVLGVDANTLEIVDRQRVDASRAHSAERAIITPNGTWLLLDADQLVPTDGTAPIALPGEAVSGNETFVTD